MRASCTTVRADWTAERQVRPAREDSSQQRLLGPTDTIYGTCDDVVEAAGEADLEDVLHSLGEVVAHGASRGHGPTCTPLQAPQSTTTALSCT